MATTRTSAVQTVPILHLRVTTGGFWQTSRTAKQKFIKLHLTPTLHPQAPALLGPDGTSRPDCPCPALQAPDSPWAWLWPLPLPAVHHTDAGPQILCLGSVRCLWAWWDGAAGVRVPARPPTHCLPRPGLLRPGLAWPAATCPGLPAPPNPAKILFLLKINLSVTEGFSGPERAVEVLGSGVPGRGEAQREGTCGLWDLLSWAHFPPSGDF